MRSLRDFVGFGLRTRPMDCVIQSHPQVEYFRNRANRKDSGQFLAGDLPGAGICSGQGGLWAEKG